MVDIPHLLLQNKIQKAGKRYFSSTQLIDFAYGQSFPEKGQAYPLIRIVVTI